MNIKTIGGHAFVAALFSATWEIAIHLPQGTPSGLLVVAGLVAPPTFAAGSLLLIAAGGRSERVVPHGQADPAYLPPAQTRRAVPQNARKELAR